MPDHNRAKMSGHSRAALAAADTLKRVIGGFNDSAFMSESSSDATRRRDERIAANPDAIAALEHGLTRAYADRVARVTEK